MIDGVAAAQDERPPSRPSSLVALPAVTVRDLTREYRLGAETVRALRGVSFSIPDRGYVAIVGPSGCGKSTLLNLLGVIDRPTGGSVVVRGARRERDGRQGEHPLPAAQRGLRLPALLPHADALRARERRAADGEAAWGSASARSARASCSTTWGSGRASATALRSSPGASSSASRSPRALANRPAMLLADEPTGELDARTGADIVALFERLNADGTTIVVVTHDETLAAATRRRIAMRDGVVTEDTGNG
jgi:putative ABC transport system ATP-binding protein